MLYADETLRSYRDFTAEHADGLLDLRAKVHKHLHNVYGLSQTEISSRVKLYFHEFGSCTPVHLHIRIGAEIDHYCFFDD
jgi:hypothetical protein